MLKAGQRFGKYRIRRRLASGGFADVFEAHDTIEGVPVALKLPQAKLREELLADFRREVRLAARLEHPCILPIKNADFINGEFAIAYPLGNESLADRLTRRLSLRISLDFAEEMISALAYAHDEEIIHCDVKPENLIVFDGDRLRLTDFGIAKIVAKTVSTSAAGTLGYMAPEQALGRPSKRSDVFSAALVTWRMLTGELPEWPFEWPLPGHVRLRRYAPELAPVLQRSLEVNARKRYRDAGAMLVDFRRAKAKVLRRLKRERSNGATPDTGRDRDWRSVRVKQFRQRYGGSLKLGHRCQHCEHPVDERMQGCPWCGMTPLVAVGETSFPQRCPRCERGVKLDWAYCPWCYGGKIGPASARTYTDRRYSAKCTNVKCRKPLMPFMRYCPWCRTKLRKRWKLDSTAKPCPSCEQPVAREFWSHCAWCGLQLSDA